MYASATVVVRKKDAEGNYTDFRQCGDYRPLNLETTLDRYPLPGIEDIFNAVGGDTRERLPFGQGATLQCGNLTPTRSLLPLHLDDRLESAGDGSHP